MSGENSTIAIATPTPNNNHHFPHSSTAAVVVCTAPLVQRLAEHRIPTHYVGRRATMTTTTTTRGESNRFPTQPKQQRRGGGSSGGPDHDSSTVQDGRHVTSSPITYKVFHADGTERRMTRQEKKAARKKMEDEKKRKAVAIEASWKQQQQQDERETTTKRQKLQGTEPPEDDDNAENDEKELPPTRPCSSLSLDEEQKQQQPLGKKDYHQLSKTNQDDELVADEHPDGQEEGRPPVLLSSPIAYLASAWLSTTTETTAIPDPPPTGSSSTTENCPTPHGSTTTPTTTTLQYDHALSQQWATSLKESMRPAETVRMGEDSIRPMAYQLVPEPWTRLRPERHITHPNVFQTKLYSAGNGGWAFPLASKDKGLPYPPPLSRDDEDGSSSSPAWVALPWRAGPTTNDNGWDMMATATTAVLEYLHKETDYHWSCGAKFGADFLLYDGPRSQRHAFGGLRIILVPPPPPPTTTTTARSTNNGHLDLSTATTPPTTAAAAAAPALAARMPSAYELAAYVRCLNTAGKLALLATVVVVDDDDDRSGTSSGRSDGNPNHAEMTPTTTPRFKVAFVDVALEKILTAPTHQRYGRSEKRRDVAKNLAKKN